MSNPYDFLSSIEHKRFPLYDDDMKHVNEEAFDLQNVKMNKKAMFNKTKTKPKTALFEKQNNN